MTSYTAIRAMNWSSLKLMPNPAEYRWAADHAEHRDSPAMLLGRAIHCMVLEPDEFQSRYFTPLARTCEGKIKSGAQCSRNAVPGSTLCRQHGGLEVDDPRELLTPDQMATTAGCAGAIAANDDAQELLEGCEREVTVEWTIDGVKCKGRLDAVAPDRVIDIKTCASLDKFARVRGDRVEAWDAMWRQYHGQMAWYRDGWVRSDAGSCSCAIAPSAYIIAVETCAPWDVAVFRLTSQFLDGGRELYQRYLAKWKACRELNDWHGRFPGVVDLELAPWAVSDEEEGF